jgi:flagellar biosynthesis/type III secretory pathway protein FliH
MRDRSKEIPSDAEIQEAGIELGWLQPGDPVPVRMRARLAKVIQEAWREGAEANTHKVAATTFSTPVLAIMAELTTSDSAISETSAAHIVAAVAPAIWRDTHKGAAHS